jgi:hypothetical protein
LYLLQILWITKSKMTCLAGWNRSHTLLRLLLLLSQILHLRDHASWRLHRATRLGHTYLNTRLSLSLLIGGSQASRKVLLFHSLLLQRLTIGFYPSDNVLVHLLSPEFGSGHARVVH